MSTRRYCDRCNADVTEQRFIRVTFVDCNTMEREGPSYDVCIDCQVWLHHEFESPPKEQKL